MHQGMPFFQCSLFGTWEGILKKKLDQDTHTALKMNGWNLNITQLKRNIIFQTSMTLGSFEVNFPASPQKGRIGRLFPGSSGRIGGVGGPLAP